jgi:hypothetical protein
MFQPGGSGYSQVWDTGVRDTQVPGTSDSHGSVHSTDSGTLVVRFTPGVKALYSVLTLEVCNTGVTLETPGV